MKRIKEYFIELGIALKALLIDFWGFIKYCSKDLEKEGKTWKDYFDKL